MDQTPAPIGTFRLHLALEGITPQIWRRIDLPAAATLGDLHRVIQVAFGWQNLYRHAFLVGARTYQPAYEDLPDDVAEADDEEWIGIDAVLGGPGERIVYRYAQSDSEDGPQPDREAWDHTISVEAILPAACAVPRCLAGERGDPFDDEGGPTAFAALLAILTDPTHPRHAAECQTVNPDYDAERCNLDEINDDLSVGLDELVTLIDGEPEDEEPVVAEPVPTGSERAEGLLPEGPVKVIGRNDRCPCGSGMKYKKCCGK
jgi:hypothetical protein